MLNKLKKRNKRTKIKLVVHIIKHQIKKTGTNNDDVE
jgi:hypothetical protein